MNLRITLNKALQMVHFKVLLISALLANNLFRFIPIYGKQNDNRPIKATKDAWIELLEIIPVMFSVKTFQRCVLQFKTFINLFSLKRRSLLDRCQ